MAILEPSYDQLRNNEHPESLTTTMTTKPRGLRWPTFRTQQALVRGSGRCAGTSTSRTVLKSGPTLRSLLTKVKDPLPTTKQSNVVYEVPCTCGKVYIGETKRRLETCLKEHKDACTRYLTDKSAIAEHARANDHPINWAEMKILQRANRTMELVMKEALSIRTTPEDARFNRDNGYELPDCWIATYKKLKGGASLNSASARRRHAHAVARGARPGMRTD